MNIILNFKKIHPHFSRKCADGQKERKIYSKGANLETCASER